MQVFPKGYCDVNRNAKGQETLDFGRAAVHMGTHLSFWPHHVEWWGTREETLDVVRFGAEILRHACAADVDWTIKNALAIKSSQIRGHHPRYVPAGA